MSSNNDNNSPDYIALQRMHWSLSSMDGYTLRDYLFVVMEQNEQNEERKDSLKSACADTTSVSNGSYVNDPLNTSHPVHEYSVLVDTGAVTRHGAPLDEPRPNKYCYDYAYSYDYDRRHNLDNYKPYYSTMSTPAAGLRNEDVRCSSHMTVDVDIGCDVDIGISNIEDERTASLSPTHCTIEGCRCISTMNHSLITDIIDMDDVDHMHELSLEGAAAADDDGNCSTLKDMACLLEALNKAEEEAKDHKRLCLSEGDFEEIVLRNDQVPEDKLKLYDVQLQTRYQYDDGDGNGDEYALNRAKLKAWFEELTDQHIRQQRGELWEKFTPPNSHCWILQVSEL